MSENITKIELYNQIRATIVAARKFTNKTVNTTMVKTYWEISRLIVEDEQQGKSRAAFGEALMKTLSNQLKKEFGKGFTERNLRNMRHFFLLYPKWHSVSAELSWTHYRSLLRVEKPKAREFYLKESIAGNWSTRQLNRQIRKSATFRLKV